MRPLTQLLSTGTALHRATLFSAAILSAVLSSSSLTAQDDEATPDAYEGLKSWVTSIAFSPDGALVAFGGGDTLIIKPGKVWFFDPAGGAATGSFEPHKSTVWSVAISPDGSQLATASQDRTVALWASGLGGKMRQSAKLEGHANWVTAIAFSPDGQLLASASEDTTVKLWNVADGKEVATLSGHSGTVRGLDFSDDGKWLATASFDKTVRIWNLAERAEKAKLEDASDAVWSVDFSSDGKHLVSAAADNTVRLYKVTVADDAPQAKLHHAWKAHSNWVSAARFSPDDSLIATASFDQRVKLWKTSDHTHWATFKSPVATVWAIAFSPDGKTLAVGTGSRAGENPTALHWTVPTAPVEDEEEVARVKALAEREKQDEIRKAAEAAYVAVEKEFKVFEDARKKAAGETKKAEEAVKAAQKKVEEAKKALEEAKKKEEEFRPKLDEARKKLDEANGL